MSNRSTAIQFFNQAVTAAHDPSNPQHKELAFQLFSSACAADPTWWNGWYQYGNNLSDLNLLPAAVAAWRRALACECSIEERAKVVSNLAWRLHDLGQLSEAFTLAKEAVALAPSEANPHINLSVVYGTMGETGNAVKHAEIARNLQPDYPIAGMALAFALLFDRQLARGFKEFEIRYQYKLKNFLQYPYPVWQGEPDKTIFLVADQGLGDTLSFSRFVPLAAAKCRYLHLYVQPQLMRLFQHAFIRLPNVNLIPMNDAAIPFPQADAWTTFVSLPYALGLTDQEIRNTPHIDPVLYSLPTTWKIPGAKLHVGIAWGGSPLNEIDKHRSIPVEHFLELYKVPGVQLYGLQVGPRVNDMHKAGGAGLIRDLSSYIGDACGTIALLHELDLVICCESALAHICALGGKECWVPYSWLGRDYRAGAHGDDVLWAPKHRFFQQGMDCRWESVFSKITRELKVRVLDAK